MRILRTLNNRPLFIIRLGRVIFVFHVQMTFYSFALVSESNFGSDDLLRYSDAVAEKNIFGRSVISLENCTGGACECTSLPCCFAAAGIPILLKLRERNAGCKRARMRGGRQREPSMEYLPDILYGLCSCLCHGYGSVLPVLFLSGCIMRVSPLTCGVIFRIRACCP